MSSSNMCVVALCFVLFAVTQSRVIKTKEFPLSSEGVTMEVLVKNSSDKAHPVLNFQIDVDEVMKKMNMAHSIRSLRDSVVTPKADFIPTVESRHGVRVGTCPLGFVRRGTFCFPDDDY